MDSTQPSSAVEFNISTTIYMDENDATAGTMTPPGGTAISLNPGWNFASFSWDLWGNYETSETNFHASYPAGEYVFALSGGALGNLNGSIDLPLSAYPAEIPYFLNFDAFQNLDPSQEHDLNFNTFDWQGGTGEAFLIIYQTNGFGTDYFISLDEEDADFHFGANELLPNTDYTARLQFLVTTRNVGGESLGESAPRYSFDYSTDMAFRTVPEPGTIAFFGITFIMAAFRRNRS